jgi:hypothetical protein
VLLKLTAKVFVLKDPAGSFGLTGEDFAGYTTRDVNGV